MNYLPFWIGSRFTPHIRGKTTFYYKNSGFIHGATNFD